MTRWRYAAATDIGQVRQQNQDALEATSTLAVIADGMGGHAAGDIAATMTVEIVDRGFNSRSTINGLVSAIQSANTAVLSDARENPERFGMGTTLIGVGLTRDGDGVVSPTLVHVGDSRAYQLRDGALRQLSEDHTIAEEWVRMGRLTPTEALSHPRRHQLTRGIGVEDTIAIDVTSIDVIAGDRILLCSDGLSNELDEDTIARLASAPTGLELAVESLVSAAKVAGGRDNISVILLEFDEVTPTAQPIRRTMSTAPPPDPGPKPAKKKRGRLTWRAWASFLLVVGVVAAFFAILHWYAYSTYYLGNDAGTIAIYRGQPSGVLWYQPVKVTDTQYSSVQLRSSDEKSLSATIEEPTLQAALHYARYMHQAWQMSRPASSTTTTTTTTKKTS